MYWCPYEAPKKCNSCYHRKQPNDCYTHKILNFFLIKKSRSSKIRELWKMPFTFLNFFYSSFFFIFLRSLLWASRAHDEKKYLFSHFWMFLIIFDHANACASMRSLVEIHNNENVVHEEHFYEFWPKLYLLRVMYVNVPKA